MDTTQHLALVSGNYSTLILMMLSLLGIGIHYLSDIAKEKQKPAPYNFNMVEYFSKTWPSAGVSFFICVGVIMTRHEFMMIPNFSSWEGIAMLLLGYFGGSALIPFINFISNKWGIKPPTDNS